MGSMPGSGRSPGGGHGNPLQYSCLGNLMDRGAWRATVHGVAKELDMTWQLNNNQWLGLCAFTAKGDGLGSISGWGTKILRATRLGQKYMYLSLSIVSHS